MSTAALRSAHMRASAALSRLELRHRFGHPLRLGVRCFTGRYEAIPRGRQFRFGLAQPIGGDERLGELPALQRDAPVAASAGRDADGERTSRERFGVRRPVLTHAQIRERRIRKRCRWMVRAENPFLELHEVLERLGTLEQLVELRFFAGLTIEEAAGVLGVSPRTAARNWAAARVWLQRELKAP